MELLRDYKHLLKPWSEILSMLLMTKESKPFLEVSSASDFIDGLQLNVPGHMNGKNLQRLLADHDLDVLQPIWQASPGRFWLQLASGPFDLTHNMPLLKKVVDYINHIEPTLS